jgi:hypothetical protein
VAKIGLHLIEKMGNYMPVGGGGETSGKRVAATLSSRQENRPDKKRRREEGTEDDRGPVRTPRSESWKERGRGGGRQRGGNGPRGGHNMGRNSNSSGYGTPDASYNNRQRDGYGFRNELDLNPILFKGTGSRDIFTNLLLVQGIDEQIFRVLLLLVSFSSIGLPGGESELNASKRIV